jgi:hypothetical protein
VLALAGTNARSCTGREVTTTSKVGVSVVALGVRQALRTTAANSAINVAKMCASVPSASVWLKALSCAASQRLAEATGSRVAFAS